MNSSPAIGDTTKELTILMPCLNEAKTLPICIKKAQSFIAKSGIDAEIIVADNGSTDGSQELSEGLGARVVNVSEKGYGAALIAGIEASKGQFVIMADSDDSYDFEHLDQFLAELKSGFQLVMGNRFSGGIEEGAMPPLHRYLGNPVLSFIGRTLFPSVIKDFHCGLRGFHRESILALDLKCQGMEFASEMVVKATLAKLRIKEVPTVLSKDGRDRPPHLRSWRDGWRHLRFLLLFSPRWLFLYPGLALFLVGLFSLVQVWASPVVIRGVTLDIHTMLFSATAVIIGLQLILFAIITRYLGFIFKILSPNERLAKFVEEWAVEKGLILGGCLLACGVFLSIYSLVYWGQDHFGVVNPSQGMRLTIPAVTMLATSVQIMFASMVLGFLKLAKKK